MARAEQVDFLLAGVTDSSGQPLSGGKVYTYKAGTLTPATLYTEQDKSSNATNPIILDSKGRASVWGDTAYYFEIKNSADVSQFTIDGLLYGRNESIVWCGDANNDGDDNFYNLSPSPSIPTVEDGMIFSFVAKDNSIGNNTYSALSVSGHTQKDFVLPDGTTYLSQGDMVDGYLYHAQYIGGAYDHYRLLNSSNVLKGGTERPDYTLSTYTTRRVLNPATATAQQCADAINTLFSDFISGLVFK